MKRVMVVMLGALIVMLLAIPVNAQLENTGIARGSRGESGGVGTQSPILDGGTYTEYETVFVPSGLAFVDNLPINGTQGLLYAYHISGLYMIGLNEEEGNFAWIHCPIPSYDKKTGGIQPKVRYLGLFYKTPGTDPTIKIDYIGISNGPYLVKEIHYNPPISSNDWTLEIIDLNGWYSFNRGLTIDMHIVNLNPTEDRDILIGGYGARFEW